MRLGRRHAEACWTRTSPRSMRSSPNIQSCRRFAYWKRFAKGQKGTPVKSPFCVITCGRYLPIDKRGADLMFQVVAARYECGSIVITTNRIFREWGKIFDVDNTLATAIIDRLMHHGEAMVIEGKSYRTGEDGDE